MLDSDVAAVFLAPGMMLAFAGVGISFFALFRLDPSSRNGRVISAVGQVAFTGGMLLNSVQQQQADKRAVIETLQVLERPRGEGPSIEPLISRAGDLNGAGPIIFAMLFGLSLGMLMFALLQTSRASPDRGAAQAEGT